MMTSGEAVDADLELLGDENTTEADLDNDSLDTDPIDEEISEEESEDESDKSKSKEEDESSTKDIEDKPIFDRPKLKAIAAKYPGIYKDFPQIKTALFREEEFSKVFPSIADAKSAAEDYSAYEELSNSVLEGDSSKFLEALDKSGETANFTVKFLDKLQNENQDLHFKIVAPYLDRAVKSFYEYGKKNNVEDIQNAAEFFANFLFGSPDFAKDKEFKGIQVKQENAELKSEKSKYQNERFNEFKSSTLNNLGDRLGGLIDKGLPKDIKPSVKNAIHRQIIEHLDSELPKDQAYMKSMASLWSKADGSESARSSIINAYLARASKPLAAKRRELLSEFLGIDKSSVDNTRNIANQNLARREGNSPSRSGSGRTQNLDPKAINWAKTSDKDFLNDKVTLKRK